MNGALLSWLEVFALETVLEFSDSMLHMLHVSLAFPKFSVKKSEIRNCRAW